MSSVISDLMTLLSAPVFITMAVVSAVVFVVTLVAIPFMLVRLPEDYFDVRVPRTWMQDTHPTVRWIGLAIKNIVGFLFLLAGISMLILPGQGILTILIGISLLDFPGKRRVEARIIGQRNVLNAVNGLRAKFGKPPLVLAPK